MIVLNTAAEVFIQDFMGIQPAIVGAVRNCVFNYSKPHTLFETLDWINYRIWNAVKSIFCHSDWQKTKRIVHQQIVTLVLSRTNFQTQEARIIFEKLLHERAFRIADNLLSDCLTVNNSWDQLSTEEARQRLQDLSFQVQLDAWLSQIRSVIDREIARRQQRN